MSWSSGSSSIETIRPRSDTWLYHESTPSAVSATRGSRRMKRRRTRLSSMLRRTRAPSQSYQVAAVWGEPSGRSVATTAGFGRRRNSSTSGGSGRLGTLRPHRDRGVVWRFGRSEPELPDAAHADYGRGRHHDPHGADPEVGRHPDQVGGRAGEGVAGRQERHRAHPVVGAHAGELLGGDLLL